MKKVITILLTALIVAGVAYWLTPQSEDRCENSLIAGALVIFLICMYNIIYHALKNEKNS